MQRHVPALSIALVATLAATAPVAAGDVFKLVGWDDLVARLGAGNQPTGTLIGVAQVEAPSGGSYGPNQSNDQFTGKTFTAMSGPPGSSGHATSVANNLYGNFSSVAPGIASIWLYEASSWATAAYLRADQPSSSPPLLPPAGVRLFNNSWIGSFGSVANDNSVLRRADFAINRDDTLHFNGMNNGAAGAYLPLMALGYNGVAVGRADGNHVSGPTPASADGAGRMKPEIVAPNSTTSFATPIVSAVAALLLETAATDPSLLANPNADDAETIKAVLLAGATHRDGWTNAPATTGPTRGTTAKPLDAVYGADLVNVDRSHLILTGGEFDGAEAPGSAPVVPAAAWDQVAVASAASRWWRFTLLGEAESLSVLATWHRTVPTNFSTPTVANFDLRLWRLDAAGQPQTLVGDPGLPFFAGGNVVSQSAVDNVEHLYVTGLAPGDYAIELDRIDAGIVPVTAAVAWIRPEDEGVFGDLDGNGIVDGADLGLLLGNWGGAGLGDLDGSGIVDGGDLGLLLGAWS